MCARVEFMALVCGRVAALAFLCACASLCSVDAIFEGEETALTSDVASNERESLLDDLQASLKLFVESGITVSVLEQKLPYDTSEESRETRKHLFNQPDDTQLPSLAQISTRVCTELDIKNEGQSAVSVVLTRAYQTVKTYEQEGDIRTVVSMDITTESRDASLTEATVTRKEFRAILECTHEYVKIYKQFKQIDVNSDGSIDRHEFESFQSPDMVFGSEEFSHIDISNDGRILFDEFAAHMMLKRSSRIDDE